MQITFMLTYMELFFVHNCIFNSIDFIDERI